jgi:hypothetical protein
MSDRRVCDECGRAVGLIDAREGLLMLPLTLFG